MPIYFDKFPAIIYNGKKAKNISLRSGISDEILKDSSLLLPYTVSDGERAEDVAFNYYGSIDYYWVVLVSNKMINYYEDWPMSSDALTSYIIQKYGDVSGKVGNEVLDWVANETILDNILYYFDEDGNIVSTDTIIMEFVPKYKWGLRKTVDGQKELVDQYLKNMTKYKPLRMYEYEFLQNEEKRKIVLLNKKYIENIKTSFEKSMKK